MNETRTTTNTVRFDTSDKSVHSSFSERLLAKNSPPKAAMSKRFETTSASAQRFTDDTPILTSSEMRCELEKRKKQNSRTSIVFGNETSSFSENVIPKTQKSQSNVAVHRTPITKPSAGSNIPLSFGIAPDYEVSSVMQDPRSLGGVDAFRGQLDVQTKSAIRKSHIHFGSESVEFKSMAHTSSEQTAMVGASRKEILLHDQQQEEMKTLAKNQKSLCRQKNFDLGEQDSPMECSTSYSCNFTPKDYSQTSYVVEMKRKALRVSLSVVE